jgi:two-component system chemotaxis response regulator CheB
MYESLMDCEYYDTILCVVLTGMGMDGTKGILNLSEKKKIHIIAQDAATCTVYGMPKAIAATGKVNQVVALQNVANEITMNVGVN